MDHSVELFAASTLRCGRAVLYAKIADPIQEPWRWREMEELKGLGGLVHGRGRRRNDLVRRLLLLEKG